MTARARATDAGWMAIPSLLAGGAAFVLGLTYVGPGCDLEFSTVGWLLVVVLGGSLGLGAVGGALTARFGTANGRPGRVALTIIALVGVAVAVPIAMALGSSVVGALQGCERPTLGNIIPPSAISTAIGAVLGYGSVVLGDQLLRRRQRGSRQHPSTGPLAATGQVRVGESQGRTRSVVAGTALMMIVTVVVAALGLTWASDFWSLGRWDRDLLGPAGARQRVVVPERGFAISFPGSWTVDTEPPADPGFVRRTGLRAVLTAALPDGESSCTVYARSGEHPTSEGCYPRAADESWGVASWDVADDVIAPLTSEYDCPSRFGIGALRQGGPVSLSFEEPSGSVLVAYHLSSGDRDFVLACDVALPWADPDGTDESWPHDAMAVDWTIQPIAKTFEFPPKEEQAQSAVATSGDRVACSRSPLQPSLRRRAP